MDSFVIDGMSVSGVSTQVGDRYRAIGSAIFVAPDVARDHFLNLVDRASADMIDVIRQIREDTKRLTNLLRKEGTQAAKAGDVDTLRGLSAEIDDALRLHLEPKSIGRIPILKKALDDKRTAFLFDRQPLDQAIASFAGVQGEFEQARAELRALEVEVDRLINEATNPATLRKLAEAGKEVAARAVMARVAEEIAQIDNAIRAAMQRLESLKQMAEAAR